MSSVNQLILENAKYCFWDEIRKDDTLAHLVAIKVIEQSTGIFGKSTISVEPWMPDKTKPGLCVVLSIEGDTGEAALYRKSYIHVMTTVGERNTKNLLLWNEKTGIGYAAGDAMATYRIPSEQCRYAARAMHSALRNFMRTCEGFAFYYDLDHTFLCAPIDETSKKMTE